MSPRQLKWVVAILAVAVVLWLASEALTSQPDDRQTGRVMPEMVEGVDRIVITKPEGTIVLARTGASWSVNEYDISNTHLGTLFTALSDTLESEIVARSAGVHARMGVDDTGVRFTFFRGGEQVDNIIFGKEGADRSTRFARRDGEDWVYRYTGPAVGLVRLSLDDWRDHVVIDALSETFGRVLVDNGTERYELSRTETGWTLSPDIDADTVAVGRLLRMFRPLEAKGFATAAQIDSIDIDAPHRRLTLFDTTDEAMIAMAFYATSNDRYWVRTDRGPIVYWLPNWIVDQVTLPRDVFLPDE